MGGKLSLGAKNESSLIWRCSLFLVYARRKSCRLRDPFRRSSNKFALPGIFRKTLINRYKIVYLLSLSPFEPFNAHCCPSNRLLGSRIQYNMRNRSSISWRIKIHFSCEIAKISAISEFDSYYLIPTVSRNCALPRIFEMSLGAKNTEIWRNIKISWILK